MSNPISKIHPERTQQDELEVGVDATAEEELSAGTSSPIEDATPIEQAPDPSEPAVADAAEQTEWSSRGGFGLATVVLAALLLASVAVNLKQSRDVAALEQKSAEAEQALDAAVARIDAETFRANNAEAALDRVDSAVDVVNEQLVGLQEAIAGLREATVR